MRTSKQIIQIIEDWFTSAKVFGHPVDIFVNPGSSDYRELSNSIKNQKKDIRYIVNLRPPGHVYMSDAMLLTHEDMLNSINRQSSDKIILGYGYISSSKIVTYRYPGAITVIGGNGKSDWDFVDKYIPGLKDWLKK